MASNTPIIPLEEGLWFLGLAQYHLSEMMGFVRETRPDLTEYLERLERDRDQIRDFRVKVRGF